MLNMELINQRDLWAKTEVKLWSEHKLIPVIVGQIYSLMGHYHPDDVDRIVLHFCEAFRVAKGVHAIASNHWAYAGTLDNLLELMRDILMRCPEFRRLNEPNYDGDWIDLEALFQNIWYYLSIEQVFDHIVKVEIPYFGGTLNNEPMY